MSACVRIKEDVVRKVQDSIVKNKIHEDVFMFSVEWLNNIDSYKKYIEYDHSNKYITFDDIKKNKIYEIVCTEDSPKGCYRFDGYLTLTDEDYPMLVCIADVVCFSSSDSIENHYELYNIIHNYFDNGFSYVEAFKALTY